MSRTYLVTKLFFMALLNLLAQNVHLGFVLGCYDAERQALSKFRLSFIEDSFGLLVSWEGKYCCDWYGVTCNNVTGYVNTLDLSNSEESLTAQKLDPSLIVLRQLNHLDLRGNDFQGSQIPEFIGSFRYLRYLDLSYANFGAVFPLQLSNLTRLEHLSLSGPDKGDLHLNRNDFVISNTRNTMEVLSYLPCLTYLQLQSCRLTSSTDFYSLFSNTTWFSKIRYLDLSENLLAGHLPNSFANWSSLQEFDLSNNLFAGSIPLWLRNMGELNFLFLFANSFSYVEGGLIMGLVESPSKLETLDISDNSLGGELASSHWNFSKGVTHGLTSLDVNNNKISGCIPAFIGNFSFEELYMSNNSLDGAIPEGLGQLNNLDSIDLSFNLLGGEVSPAHFANLSSLSLLSLSNNPIHLIFDTNWTAPFQLTSLDLSSCRVGAQMPGWIRSQTLLEILFLSNSDISGNVPHFLCQLSNLSFLDLESNKLVGTIPDCWRLPSLGAINLSSNKLAGPIPKSIGLLQALRFLSLNNNSLGGRIPDTFSLLSKLVIMDLGENKLFGGIPDLRLNSLPSLAILRLRSNKLVGLIPESLCSLPSIQLLDLSNNNFTGTIPQCFGNFNGMKLHPSATATGIGIDDFIAYEKAIEVLKGEQLEYTSNLEFVKNLDLSCNGLVGSIPEGIANLSGLIGFNLSHNHLTGSIPYNIGKMTSLESLDLSNNLLSGKIPSSLAALTSVSSLNLSNNKLHGQIPTGSQLQVLNYPSIYGGNPGLCGDPLPNECRTTDENNLQQQPQEEQDKEDTVETMLFYLVIMSGFATGFWGVVGSLLLRQKFRFALFRFVEKIADYLYVQVMVRINRLRN